MDSPSVSLEVEEAQAELTNYNSSMDDQTIIRPVTRTTGTPAVFVMGKHRMAAAISSLDQQIIIIQEELDQLESYGQASIVCKELVSIVQSKPDALLPVTKGPADVKWDRWFQGANGSRRNKRWI